METVTITKELFDSLVREKARELNREEMTHCVDKWRAMEILGCGERTFYKKLNAKGSCIRRGSKNGSFVKSSVIKERDRLD
ncbi:MAG: hypothetical protein AAF600_13150 [Bacteroidota bacterium]